jgi:hypothetical protein
MSVRIDRAVSEVTIEPESAPDTGAGPEPDWAALDRQRAMQDRLRRDRLRTQVEGFDD